MDEMEHGHHHETHVPRPYWKRAHRDWRFWIAVFFVFNALAIYVLGDDLALVPRATHNLTPSISSLASKVPIANSRQAEDPWSPRRSAAFAKSIAHLPVPDTFHREMVSI
jgi:hypothetical protein